MPYSGHLKKDWSAFSRYIDDYFFGLICLNRVTTSQSLFFTVPPCLDDSCDNSELNLDRCSCRIIGGTLDVTCGLPLTQFNDLGGDFDDETENVQDGNRKKRDNIYSDDIIYLYDDGEPKGNNFFTHRKRRSVNMQMSLENATEYCSKTILGTTAAKVCMEISGVNASTAIQSCAADLQVNCNANSY